MLRVMLGLGRVQHLVTGRLLLVVIGRRRRRSSRWSLLVDVQQRSGIISVCLSYGPKRYELILGAIDLIICLISMTAIAPSNINIMIDVCLIIFAQSSKSVFVCVSVYDYERNNSQRMCTCCIVLMGLPGSELGGVRGGTNEWRAEIGVFG